MPRTTADIVSQADRLAKKFEHHDPDPSNVRDTSSLRGVRKAFQQRALAERELADAVQIARDDGQSWAAIGTMLGTSGEAARQRYGAPLTKSR